MKNFTIATIALTMTLALPLVAMAAETRLTEAQLKKDKNVVAFCKKDDKSVATAKYINDTDNSVEVTCSDDVEGFVPLAALGGLGTAAGVAAAAGVLAAVAGGGDNSTPDTQ